MQYGDGNGKSIVCSSPNTYHKIKNIVVIFYIVSKKVQNLLHTYKWIGCILCTSWIHNITQNRKQAKSVELFGQEKQKYHIYISEW